MDQLVPETIQCVIMKPFNYQVNIVGLTKRGLHVWLKTSSDGKNTDKSDQAGPLYKELRLQWKT